MRRDLETRAEAVNLQDEQYIRKTADRMQDVVRGQGGGLGAARPVMLVSRAAWSAAAWDGPPGFACSLNLIWGPASAAQGQKSEHLLRVRACSRHALSQTLPLWLFSHCVPQGQKFEYLLNTGNLVSRSGLDLSQSTGFTVVAEKLNYHR